MVRRFAGLGGYGGVRGSLQKNNDLPGGMLFNISSLQLCLNARWRIGKGGARRARYRTQGIGVRRNGGNKCDGVVSVTFPRHESRFFRVAHGVH